jgi:hypothetical protein
MDVTADFQPFWANVQSYHKELKTGDNGWDDSWNAANLMDERSGPNPE